jgi:hypothetical protein
MQGCAKSQICGSIYPSASLLLVWYPSIVTSVGTSSRARSINVQVAINIANLLPLLRVSTEASNWSIAINTHDGGNKRSKVERLRLSNTFVNIRKCMNDCASSQLLLMLKLTLYQSWLKDKESLFSIRVSVVQSNYVYVAAVSSYQESVSKSKVLSSSKKEPLLVNTLWILLNVVKSLSVINFCFY